MLSIFIPHSAVYLWLFSAKCPENAAVAVKDKEKDRRERQPEILTQDYNCASFAHKASVPVPDCSAL